MSRLLPDDVASTLPPLIPGHWVEWMPEPIAHLKFFAPDTCWRWYVTKFDPSQRLCFGPLTRLDHTDSGASRSTSWKPRPLSQCPR